MRVTDDERPAFVAAVVASAGRVIVCSDTGEVIHPSSEIGAIAAKVGHELRTTGRELFALLQPVNDEIAKYLIEAASDDS